MRIFVKYLISISFIVIPWAAFGQPKTNIFVATGPTTGVYYPMGGGLADILTKYMPNLNATAGTTDGALANLLLMGQGRADVAFSMADTGWDAFKGQDKFAAAGARVDGALPESHACGDGGRHGHQQDFRFERQARIDRRTQ
jgi:TRAP-type uncharacterized transport system substrate-binding protein